MCGEHSRKMREGLGHKGSSPHVRGAHGSALLLLRRTGIIPACAGSTSPCSLPCRPPRDHPRMCGEHAMTGGQPAGTSGSSPHVRGARRLTRVKCSTQGIIPACAGSTSLARLSSCSRRDHPRMCGEHFNCDIWLLKPRGSSPHVRGAPNLKTDYLPVSGIIPACAGSTPIDSGEMLNARDHPRMCGEHSFGTDGFTGSVGSSPHVRGARS